jgi:uncharacterized DUF497 family protein
VRLVADPELAAWLSVRPAFEWDAGNRTKSAGKHGITPTEVESVFENPFVFEGTIVEPAHQEVRGLLLGVTSTGKMVALVFTRRGDRIRPISSRPMRRNERHRHAKQVGH